MRSFIAIELPDAVKSSLSTTQEEMKKCGADIRWVRPEGIHLTLKFLGNIEEKDVVSIIEVLKGTCENYTVFNLNISGLGFFPNNRSPRVIWVGIKDSESVSVLQTDIEEGLSSLGFERENRKYSPHLTLGRFRSSRGKQILINQIEAIKNKKFGAIKVGSVSLMKSELNPKGAKYTRVAEILLKDSNRN